MEKLIQQSCPSCKHEFLSKVDLPDPPQTVASVAVNQDLTALARENEKLKGELGKAAEKLREAQQDIAAWQSGERHANFDPQEVEECPNCGPRLQKYVRDKIGKLTRAEVRELARAYHDWPPPTIDLTGIKLAKK